MKPLSIAIQFRDYMTLVVVWELQQECWEILSIVRMNRAIATTLFSPTTRLVLPTGVLPNGVWGGVCKKHPAKTNNLKADSEAKKTRVVASATREFPRTEERFSSSSIGS